MQFHLELRLGIEGAQLIIPDTVKLKIASLINLLVHFIFKS